MREHVELKFYSERTADEQVLQNYPSTIKRKVLRCAATRCCLQLLLWKGQLAGAAGPALEGAACVARGWGARQQTVHTGAPGPCGLSAGCSASCTYHTCLHATPSPLIWPQALVHPSCLPVIWPQAPVPGRAARLLPVCGLQGAVPGPSADSGAHGPVHAQRE